MINLLPSRILIRARDLIANEECWTQHEYALSAEGGPVKPNSPSAVKFCSLGALAHAGRVPMEDFEEYISFFGTNWGIARKALEDVAVALGYQSIVDLNDQADHATVISAFNIAIARLEQNGQ